MIKPIDDTEIYRSMEQTGEYRIDERKLYISLEYYKDDISFFGGNNLEIIT